MIRGLYASALGMTTQMRRMDVVSNNIANAGTTGFRQDTIVTRSFSDELMNRLRDSSDTQRHTRIGMASPGLFVDDVFTDFSGGSIVQTEGTLDVAIMGDGFFSIGLGDVDTVRYTRDGSFTLSQDRMLMTTEGNLVLGENGTITLPDGYIVIDEQGGVFVDGEFIDRLRMFNVEDKQTLRKIGDNLFNSSDQTVETPFVGGLISGALESSNVNPVREMVSMINLSRTYEANQRIIAMFDTVMGQASSDVGRRV
jgi:flagellar basal-body rod protein FlgG